MICGVSAGQARLIGTPRLRLEELRGNDYGGEKINKSSEDPHEHAREHLIVHPSKAEKRQARPRKPDIPRCR
jgi:hypothetical protein